MNNFDETLQLQNLVDSDWEYPKERLKVSNSVLGSGVFGVVVRGVADGIKDLHGEVTVAVKTVKGISSFIKIILTKKKLQFKQLIKQGLSL